MIKINVTGTRALKAALEAGPTNVEDAIIIGDCNCVSCMATRQYSAVIQPLRKICKSYTARGKLPFLFQHIMSKLAPDEFSYNPSSVNRALHQHLATQPIADDLQREDKLGRGIEVIQRVLKHNLTQRRMPLADRAFCASCGRIHHKHDLVCAPGDRFKLCRECAAVFQPCDQCGTTHLEGELSMVQTFVEGSIESVTRKLCETCVGSIKTCRGCSQIWPKELMCFTQINGELSPLGGELANLRYSVRSGYCPECVAEYYRPCGECGMYTMTRIQSDRSDVARGICDECHKYTEPINEYGFRPTPIFRLDPKVERKSPLFFGSEVEFEMLNCCSSRKALAGRVLKRFEFKDVYIKKDSSLSNGLELVTQPFSFAYFQSLSDNWKNFYDLLRDEGAGTSSTCGLHFHVPKSAFSTGHMFKFCKMFYDPNHRSWMKKFSGREGSWHYASWAEEDVRRLPSMAKNKSNPSDKRYSVLNLRPENTVEIRMFRSPKTAELLFSKLECVNSLFWFTNTVGLKDTTMTNFLTWVHDNAGINKNLIAEIG